MFKAGIITASDKGHMGLREDKSGKAIEDILRSRGYVIDRYALLPDDREKLTNEMIHMSDNLKLDLIITTGGTGFSPRDVTPEATREAVHRLAPGISEAIRYYSLSITPRAMLSRGISGIRNKTLIINLPGSPKAVKESLEYIIDTIHHGLEILTERDSECGSN